MKKKKKFWLILREIKKNLARNLNRPKIAKKSPEHPRGRGISLINAQDSVYYDESKLGVLIRAVKENWRCHNTIFRHWGFISNQNFFKGLISHKPLKVSMSIKNKYGKQDQRLGPCGPKPDEFGSILAELQLRFLARFVDEPDLELKCLMTPNNYKFTFVQYNILIFSHIEYFL